MTHWTVDQLCAATGGELVTGDPAAPARQPQSGRAVGVSGIGIDSRRIQPREAFLAIQGPRFDGHAFLSEVVRRGASCLIVSQIPDPPLPVPTIRVADTVRALGDLAAFHRARFRVAVVAVTGSCGKTTTKELVAHLLEADRRVLKTQGTENNHIGLPLTLLRLSASHDVAVVELGSNHPGEIAYLARIARPTLAVITNAGPAHLEFFGSLDAVRREKLSLLDALDSTGSAVLPGDQLDVLLQAKSRVPPHATLLTFGISSQCGVQAAEIRRQAGGLTIRLRDTAGDFFVPLLGAHNVENALAALACVQALGIPLESVRERLASFPTLPLRSQLIQCRGVTLLNDCYNANPLSFARALDTLINLDVKRTVVIAGDMLELGAVAQSAHQAIGQLAARLGIDVVIAVGSYAEAIAQGASDAGHACVKTYPTIEALQPHLGTLIREGDGVLIKGSRRLHLEQVTDSLLRHVPDPTTCLGSPQASRENVHSLCPSEFSPTHMGDRQVVG